MNWSEIIYHDYFSGVGGFAYGFLQAGIKFKKHYFSEIDKHSIAVYKYHFHEAESIGDITTFSGESAERPNILTFGFPCQDLSIAGKRRGLVGERSGLFFHALRLVKKYLPEVFVFENVEGLLSSNEGQDFEIVLRAISDIGLYECEWQLVNTRWVLPQNRERVYFVGHFRGASRPRVFPFREGDKEFIKAGQPKGDGVVCNAVDSNYWKGADGKRTMICDSGLSRSWEERDVAPPMRCNTGVGHGNLVIQKTSGQTVTVKEDETGTLQAGGMNIRDKVPNIIQANPLKFVRTDEGKRLRKQYEAGQLDHGFNEHRQLEVSDDESCGTLDTNLKSQLINAGHIRRLTEVECERLQGFPDGWTEFGDYDGVIKKVSKTQRYKQMGNAVTTIWPMLIAKRLMQDGKN